jgi:hypothetical protein
MLDSEYLASETTVGRLSNCTELLYGDLDGWS